LSDLSITEESKNGLKVTSFKKIPYGVVEGFARKLQDFKAEFDNDLTENNWGFSSRYASADTDMMEYGANRSGNSYVIFIGDKTKSFYSDSLMDSIANAFIELHENLSDKYAKGGYMEHGGMLDEETKYKIDNGFLKRDMNEILNRLLPYNFGFKVFKPSNELTPNYDDAPSSLYGYDDKDIKSKLYFPQYKRDHDINFKITQGGENTYFDFYLNDSEGNEWIGTFGFKDEGDVDSTYITKFIAFLMECYGLPFQVVHSVMAKGGDVI
jgi:hypothetical protein